jgi:hypothetical protein
MTAERSQIVFSTTALANVDAQVLRSVLLTLNSRVSAEWVPVDGPGARVVFFPEGEAPSTSDHQIGLAVRRNGMQREVLFHNRVIPLRPMPMIELLDEIAGGSAPTGTGSPRPSATGRLPLGQACQLALPHIDAGRTWCLKGESIHLWLGPGRVAGLDGEWQQFIAEAGGSWTEWESPEGGAPDGIKKISLDRALWAAGIRSTQLLPGLAAGQRYGLSRWPNLATLERRPSHPRLCAVLVDRRLTAAELASAVGVQPTEAIGFMNACHLCGYLVAEQQAPAGRVRPAQAAPERSGMGGLLSMLRRKIGI